MLETKLQFCGEDKALASGHLSSPLLPHLWAGPRASQTGLEPYAADDLEPQPLYVCFLSYEVVTPWYEGLTPGL